MKMQLTKHVMQDLILPASTSRMQGGQQLYIVFAEAGIKQRVSNMGSFAQNKIWG